MARGRDICNTLKAIRKQIADANGIAYSPEECHFTGECKGTCPKCEQDVRDLEYELRRRQIAGKAIKVVGIAAGLVALTACSDGKPQRNASDMVTGETIIVKKEEPNPRNRQLEGAISLGNKEKLLEEENRKDGEASYNPSLETKEIKKNIKGNSSKNQGRNAVTRSAIGIDSIESSKIFDNADEEASFPGGIAACMKYIADNFRYPNIQGDCSIQGKFVVTFTVNEDGNLSDIKVKKSVYSDLDKEAVRVVKSMPSWIPAKQNGKAVKSRYTLPVYIHVQ